MSKAITFNGYKQTETTPWEHCLSRWFAGYLLSLPRLSLIPLVKPLSSFAFRPSQAVAGPAPHASGPPRYCFPAGCTGPSIGFVNGMAIIFIPFRSLQVLLMLAS